MKIKSKGYFGKNIRFTWLICYQSDKIGEIDSKYFFGREIYEVIQSEYRK